MIAYKVVLKEYRYGSNFALYFYFKKRNQHASNKTMMSRIKNKITKLKLEEYYPRYTPRSVIKAAPKSSGIFCFLTRIDAQAFIDSHCLSFSNNIKKYFEIIKVNGYERNKLKVKFVQSYDTDDLEFVLASKRYYQPCNIPGVVTFKSVKVLE